jgi:hypothetical protein
VNCLADNNFEAAQAGLYNLNQCLTDDYAVRISTNSYDDQVSDRTVFQCDHCTMEHTEIINKGEEDEHTKTKTVPNEIHYSKIKILERDLSKEEKFVRSFSQHTETLKFRNNYKTSSMDNLVNGFTVSQKISPTTKYWICTECNQDNYQKDGEWNTIKSIRERPFALGVIPEPPKKPNHLIKSLGYPDKFSKWFFSFLEEIQAKMVQYRIEYVAINGHDMEESSFKDKGDK